jgi:hypothetical protein
LALACTRADHILLGSGAQAEPGESGGDPDSDTEDAAEEAVEQAVLDGQESDEEAAEEAAYDDDESKLILKDAEGTCEVEWTKDAEVRVDKRTEARWKTDDMVVGGDGPRAGGLLLSLLPARGDRRNRSTVAPRTTRRRAPSAASRRATTAWSAPTCSGASSLSAVS